MRHAVFGRKLSRDTKARKALLNNLASSLIVHGSLNTTLAKAKFAQGYIEKLVSHSKKNNLNRNRILASKLTSDAFLKLINEIRPGFESKKGGYTRVLKIPARRGDAAQMAKLEFLEWDKSKVKAPKEKSVKTAVTRKKGSQKVQKGRLKALERT